MDDEDEFLDINTLASLTADIQSFTLSLPPGMSILTREISEGLESQPEHGIWPWLESQPKHGIRPFKKSRYKNKIDVNIATSTVTLAAPLISDLEEEEKKLVSSAIINLSKILKEDNPDADADQCVQTSMQFIGTADQIYSQRGLMKLLLVSSQHDFSNHRWVFYTIYSDYNHLRQNARYELQTPWIPGLSTNTEYYAQLYAWSEIKNDKDEQQIPTDIRPQIRDSPLNKILMRVSGHMGHDISEVRESGINQVYWSDVNEVRELVRNGNLTEEIAGKFAEELAKFKIRNVKDRTNIEEFDVDSLQKSLKDMILTPV